MIAMGYGGSRKEAGKATEIVDNAMRFCGDYTREHDQTRRFTAALIENELLIDRNIDVTLAEIAQHEARCRQLLAAPARRKPARAAS